MSNRLKKSNEALNILSTYRGTNPYIIDLKNKVLVYQTGTLNSFQEEYILKNHDKEPIPVNKLVRITDWFAKSKEEEWGVYTEKLVVAYFMGETSKTYHIYGKYRRSQTQYESIFLPKTATLTDFLVEDYTKKDINFTPYNEKSGRILKPHQEMGVKFLLTRKKGILALNMGGGKSMAAIVAALEGNFNKVLVICPASVKTTWKEELGFFLPEEEITIVEGKKWKESRFTIINYDILDNFYTVPTEIVDRRKKIINDDGSISYITEKKEVVSRKQSIIDAAMADSQLFQSNFDCIIIDEVHMLSNKDSIRYKTISDLIKRSNPEYIFELTGTPLRNNPLNFYYILKLIGATITEDYGNYVLRYCDGKQIYMKGDRDKISQAFIRRKGKSSWYDLTKEEKTELDEHLDKNARKIWLANGASRLDELQEATKHLYLRETDFGNALNIKKEVKVLNYEMDFNEKQQYESAWNEYVNTHSQEDVEALKKLDDNRKLIEGSVFRQLTANFMVKRSISLAESHISHGDKVIIFCCFDEELYALRDHFKDMCVIYNGKMTAKQKDEARNRFMTDPNCKVFIGNIQSANAGITLISSCVTIFNNFSFVPSENLQCENRNYRLGQTKDCVVYYQILNGTYMEHMKKILDLKNAVIEKVIVDSL